MIPELEPHSGSWVVTEKNGGRVVGEFYGRRMLEKMDRTGHYLIETAAQYLARVNAHYAAQGDKK